MNDPTYKTKTVIRPTEKEFDGYKWMNKDDLRNRKQDCPPGKVRNPKTGRCINDKTQKKDCPPGKVRNPKTGRCIKDKTAKIVEPIVYDTDETRDDTEQISSCPPGKVRNPKTGRCIKAKQEKKECASGKVRDPKTGLCVETKIRNIENRKSKLLKEMKEQGKIMGMKLSKIDKRLEDLQKKHKIEINKLKYERIALIDTWDSLMEKAREDGVEMENEIERLIEIDGSDIINPNEIIGIPAGFEDIAEKCSNKGFNGWIVDTQTGKLGTGVAGSAYTACIGKNDCQYVVKVQPTGVDEQRIRQVNKSYTEMDSYQHEMEALIDLQGWKHAPKLYAAWTCKKSAYFVMEKLGKCHKEPSELYNQTIGLLKELYDKKWLHLDVHSGNIMCRENGDVVLIDYGRARKFKNEQDLSFTNGHAGLGRYGGKRLPSELFISQEHMVKKHILKGGRANGFMPRDDILSRPTSTEIVEHNKRNKQTLTAAVTSIIAAVTSSSMFSTTTTVTKKIYEKRIAYNAKYLERSAKIYAELQKAVLQETTSTFTRASNRLFDLPVNRPVEVASCMIALSTDEALEDYDAVKKGFSKYMKDSSDLLTEELLTEQQLRRMVKNTASGLIHTMGLSPRVIDKMKAYGFIDSNYESGQFIYSPPVFGSGIAITPPPAFSSTWNNVRQLTCDGAKFTGLGDTMDNYVDCRQDIVSFENACPRLALDVKTIFNDAIKPIEFNIQSHITSNTNELIQYQIDDFTDGTFNTVADIMMMMVQAIVMYMIMRVVTRTKTNARKNDVKKLIALNEQF
jgi:hypothetical protein